MKRKWTFEDVRRIGLTLPGVEETATYGAPSLKVRGKMLACPATNRSAEPGSIVVRVSIDQREALIAEAPEIYYVTEHYVKYPSVLVRLANMNEDALRGLLRMSLQFVTRKILSDKRGVRKPGPPRR